MNEQKEKPLSIKEALRLIRKEMRYAVRFREAKDKTGTTRFKYYNYSDLTEAVAEYFEKYGIEQEVISRPDGAFWTVGIKLSLGEDSKIFVYPINPLAFTGTGHINLELWAALITQTKKWAFREILGLLDEDDDSQKVMDLEKKHIKQATKDENTTLTKRETEGLFQGAKEKINELIEKKVSKEIRETALTRINKAKVHFSKEQNEEIDDLLKQIKK